MTTERKHLFFQIDRTFVFQVDLSQFRGVRGVEEHTSKEPDGIARVPNFVLCFESCSFRVFSEQALSINAPPHDVGPLKSAVAHVNKAASSFQRTPTRSYYERSVDEQAKERTSLHQDTDSSVLSSNELGQNCNRESQVDQLANEMDAHGDEAVPEKEAVDTVPLTAESDSEGSIMRRIKRRRTSLHRSWDSLQSLQAVLEMPLASALKADDVADMIGPILTATAEDLSSSYCRSIDISRALQSCDDDIMQCEKELDDVFTAGFPPPRSKKRRGMNGSPAKIPECNENTEVLIETTKILLRKQKEGVEQRLRLALLPTRG